MNRLSVVAIMIAITLQSFAQISTSSPYSRFGLGDLQQNVFPIYSAFGGASTAYSLSLIHI